MKNKFFLINFFCIVIFSLAVFNTSFATEPNISGPSIGIGLGHGSTTSENTITKKSNAQEQASYESGANGLAASIFFSYIKIIHKALLGGSIIFQHYSMNGGELDLTTKNNFKLQYFEPNYGFAATLLAGYMIQTHLFVYFLLGPAWTDYQYALNESGTASGDFNDSAFGILYGVGLLIPMAQHIALGASYKMLSTSTIDRTLPAAFVTNNQLSFKPTTSIFQLSMIYSFG